MSISTGSKITNSDMTSALNNKQDTLVSGTNIKTVGGTSLLGSGDVTISVGSVDTVKPASIANGTVVILAEEGAAGVYYNGNIWACISGGNSNLGTFTINGHVWTVPTTGTFSLICKATGRGRTIGQTLTAFTNGNGLYVNCSNGSVKLSDGSTNEDTLYNYGTVASRAYP